MATGGEQPRLAAEPPASLLHNRNFLLLWAAYAVSAFGDHVSELAILKTQNALQSDTSTAMMARMTFLFFVPFVVFGPITGLLADRLPRRAVMVTADVCRAGIMLGFAAFIGWTQDWSVWGPYLPLLLLGTFAAAFSPARFALLPTLIRPNQLVRANGMISGLGIIATMASAVVGGQLARHCAPQVAFRVDAATYVASAVLLLILIPPRQARLSAGGEGASSSIRQIAEGFRYARVHRRVLELLAVAVIVWFCGSLLTSVLPAVVRDVYGGDLGTIGIYRAFFGLGIVVGSLIVTSLGSALRSEVALTWGLFGVSGGVGLFTLSVFLPMSPGLAGVLGATGIILAGLFGVATMASYNSLLQRIVADRFRGRVFGVKDICATGGVLLATGLLAVPQWPHLDHWVGYILLVVAVLTFCAGWISLRIRLARSPLHSALSFAVNLNEFWAKFWYRLQVKGHVTVPHAGPVIITANHTCSADPLFICAAVTYRPLAFMVAREFSNVPVARFFLRLVECIPVRRDGNDTAATKQALRHLRAGKALGIFIEGRIIPPGEVGEPRDGVALLALKTGARVIPAHISGTQYHDGVVRGMLARHRAQVRFGPPVDLSEFNETGGGRDATRSATAKIYAAIKALDPTRGSTASL